MKTYEITYAVGNAYRRKRIIADSVEQACKRAKVKNIIDIDILEYRQRDKYQLRDF